MEHKLPKHQIVSYKFNCGSNINSGWVGLIIIKLNSLSSMFLAYLDNSNLMGVLGLDQQLVRTMTQSTERFMEQSARHGIITLLSKQIDNNCSFGDL